MIDKLRPRLSSSIPWESLVSGLAVGGLCTFMSANVELEELRKGNPRNKINRDHLYGGGAAIYSLASRSVSTEEPTRYSH